MVLNRTLSQLKFKNELKVNKTDQIRKQEEEQKAKLSQDLKIKEQKRFNGIEKEYYFRKDVFDYHMEDQKEHKKKIKRNKTIQAAEFQKKLNKIVDQITKSDLQT